MRDNEKGTPLHEDDVPMSFDVDGGCFGCSPSNPSGLQLRFRRRGDTVVADYTIPDRFHGAPGIAHGGVIAAMLDEVSCAVAHAIRNLHVVTGELSVRYQRPCPVEVPLSLTARIRSDHPRYLVIDAEVQQGDQRLAYSSGKFFFTRGSSSAP
jgi:acyl-coenzyme A thioesterase PaaI-like protein